MNYFIYNTTTRFVKAKTDNTEIRDGFLSGNSELGYIASENEAEHNEVKVESGALVADNIQIAQAKADEVRAERSRLLSQTDWRVLSDNEASAEWLTYRQALRDVPAQSGFPQNVTWPTQPE